MFKVNDIFMLFSLKKFNTGIYLKIKKCFTGNDLVPVPVSMQLLYIYKKFKFLLIIYNFIPVSLILLLLFFTPK